MDKVVFDSNVWDQLESDEPAKARINEMCVAALLEVIVPRTLSAQLNQKPFFGVPKWFPTTVTLDSVTVLGHSRLGTSRLGEGEIYTAHRGQSRQVSDAVIADAAHTEAAIFVSDDNRARKRYAKLTDGSKSLTYAQFRANILGIRPQA